MEDMNDDDREKDRMASDNPAMTIPASHSISRPQFERIRSRGRAATTSDPAADMTEVTKQPTSSSTFLAPTRYDVGWRRVVRNFSPSWFSVTMGTGIVSVLLISIPFKAAWLYWLSVAFFILNAVLFTCAFLISVLRYTLYPEIWSVMIADPTNSLFLGTVPMGFATLLQSWIWLCCPYWGYWSVTVAWAMWMVDAVVAVAVTVSLPFLLMSRAQRQELDRITAAQLLPIAATIVAAGAGAKVAEILRDEGAALGTLITSYVMWGMATPFAMTVLVIYYQRLALHKLPPREVVVSSFLPLGPLGMGGFTIMYLGKVARQVFPRVEFFHNLSIAGDVVYVMGVFIALIMWGFGLCWLVFALATIYTTRPFPFNMGWWGFTFPLGVYAISTMTFGVEMPSLFFKVLGTIMSVAVIILWCIVAAGTARGAWSGHLFNAPCLKQLKKEDRKPKEKVDDREKLPET
ncbi:hypothetical protein LTR84_006454 [Exophiala bonariae]|uniref:Sulfite efflux pump SSU1 n=1 Tax=Exophiala bonariae TaxID=1690606 RepID=A0AAV9N192_9EURO|nr:hypothetical protein LTR84_006454 [Exophiala bonariae]